MANIFGIGTSALLGLQQAISTTGQNIANVNTEGYSRQTVEFGTTPPDRRGSYYLGSGTQIKTIERAYDKFLTEDVWNRTATASYFDDLSGTANRVDELLGDSTTGLGPSLQSFFAAMEAVGNSPTTLPERQVLISEAETLAQRFAYVDTRLGEFQSELNVKTSSSVRDINQYAQSIAALNNQISLQEAQTGGSASADLLDLRDTNIRELAQLVGVSTQLQDDGSMNVFIGKGQPLVVGGLASTLQALPNPQLPNQLDIYLSSGSNPNAQSNITNLISDGSLGASLDAGNNIIQQARREIGLLAAGVTVTYNAIHESGYDLNGNTGISMFSSLAAQPAVSDEGGVALDVQITDISQLGADNFRLTYNGTDYNLVNLTTNKSEVITGAEAGAPPSFDRFGMTFSFASTPVVGESYVIEPVGTSAANFAVLIDDPSQIAAAQESDTVPGTSAGVGDNRNILALLDLRDTGVLKGGASYLDLYTNTASEVAVQARRANTLAETEASLLSSAESRQGNLAGVNLEEEAANLIRYQQAYQAAAQVVKTGQEIFDILLRATE